MSNIPVMKLIQVTCSELPVFADRPIEIQVYTEIIPLFNLNL
jgi:hypothetical protein